MPYFDDLKVGERNELGSFTFTADLIKQFAHQFDPQPFHLDEEAGRQSLFGGLAASGWHVSAIGMKLIVAGRRREIERSAALGLVDPPLGPSPGFRELKWHRPVLAGDTLSYWTEIETLRESASKPEWGLMQARNGAHNQRGELVFSFLAMLFVPRHG